MLLDDMMKDDGVDTLSREKAEELEQAIRAVSKTKQGRTLIWEFLSRCGIFTLSFTGEPATTDFNEGTRSVGLWLLSLLDDADPNLIIQLMTEAKEDKDNARRTNDTSRGATNDINANAGSEPG